MNMNNDQDKDNNSSDFERYLKEIESLQTDFSDLEDLDLEEIQDIQDAIEEVKEMSTTGKDDTFSAESVAQETKEDYQKNLMSDFSDIGKMELEDLIEMKSAVESVKQEEFLESEDEKIKTSKTRDIPTALEKKIEEELQKKKEGAIKEEWTPERFTNYLKDKRKKIYYHALYYLIFQVNDHIASKEILYEMLKEVVSKSPIDPIQEHQFYFGIGHLLKLEINGVSVVRYLLSGKFKINADVDLLKNILTKIGKPVSTKPVIEPGEQKKMFKEFLNDDLDWL